MQRLTEFLCVYRVIIDAVITQIPTAQILSRFVKHLAFFSYQTDICFVIWPVHFTGPLAHSFLCISNRFGGRTCNCFIFDEDATTFPTTSGKRDERTALVDAREGSLSSRVIHGGSTCPAGLPPEAS